jgi:nucleoid-associated protein YgaU
MGTFEKAGVLVIVGIIAVILVQAMTSRTRKPSEAGPPAAPAVAEGGGTAPKEKEEVKRDPNKAVDEAFKDVITRKDAKRGEDVNREEPAPQPGADADPEGTYRVRSGDKLITIAEKAGVDWKALRDLNRIDPKKLKAGMLLKLPPKAAPAGEHAKAEKDAKNEPRATPEPAPRTVPVVKADVPKPRGKADTEYRVRRGDTLAGLASKFYKNRGRWHEIYAANRNILASPSALRPNQTLRIP